MQSTAGSDSLRTFLDSLYDDGAQGRDFAVFRLNSDVVLSTSGDFVGNEISFAEDVGNEPRLVFDADIRLDVRGATYFQDFDIALGSDPNAAGRPLPTGWTANIDGIINTAITGGFPPPRLIGTFNAGEGSDPALIAANSNSAQENALQLFAKTTGGLDVRLAFSVEAWGGYIDAENPGEAARACRTITYRNCYL